MANNIQSFLDHRRGAAPDPAPPEQGAACGGAASSLEYIYSSFEQASISLDNLDDEDWDSCFDPLNFEASQWPERCPNVKGRILVVRAYPLSQEYGGELLYRGMVLNLTCNRWNCKPCARQKIRQLYARVSVGGMVKETTRLLAAGYKYPVKMFHLTLPGREYRETHTILEGLHDLRAAQHNLIRAMTHKYGKFHYFCAVEPHKSGWPHLHILFVSEAIAASKPLRFVEDVWRYRYGMGYVYVTVKTKRWNNDLKRFETAVVKSALDAVTYATKYMWKGISNFGEGVNKNGERQSRVWSKLLTCSRGALGSLVDLVDDRGFPVFLQLHRDSPDDEILDLINRKIDCYPLFETKSRSDLECIRDTLGGDVLACRVNSEYYLELKEEYPNALLPKVYVRKCPVCGRKARDCKCGKCVRCGLPKESGDELIEVCQCVSG